MRLLWWRKPEPEHIKVYLHGAMISSHLHPHETVAVLRRAHQRACAEVGIKPDGGIYPPPPGTPITCPVEDCPHTLVCPHPEDHKEGY